MKKANFVISSAVIAIIALGGSKVAWSTDTEGADISGSSGHEAVSGNNPAAGGAITAKEAAVKQFRKKLGERSTRKEERSDAAMSLLERKLKAQVQAQGPQPDAKPELVLPESAPTPESAPDTTGGN